jgi:hypothetical protein
MDVIICNWNDGFLKWVRQTRVYVVLYNDRQKMTCN